MQLENQQNSELNQNSIEDIPLPPKCQVIFYNDDFTTKDFVVELLKGVFNKTEQIAIELMEQVHNSGCAIVGTYTYDIALTRVTIANNRAKKEDFPLRIEVKKI